MPFNLSKTVLETQPGSITFPDGSKLSFRYRPYAYTPRHEDLVEEAKSGVKVGPMLKAMLLPLLETWDVVVEAPGPPDEAGQPTVVQTPVPLDDDGLSDVPLPILSNIIAEIGRLETPGEAKGASSEGSFS